MSVFELARESLHRPPIEIATKDEGGYRWGRTVLLPLFLCFLKSKTSGTALYLSFCVAVGCMSQATGCQILSELGMANRVRTA